ncbi:MAG: hypothetical protein F7C35_05100 [Desulfurococcales archaeon]|nr:hypothetical protein [Desulfurococcales archaeon]
MPPKVRYEHRDIGVCPKCNAPAADYIYKIEGPIGEERDTVRVTVTIRCSLCGYTENKKILFPVKALNLIKYLLIPEMRPIIERLYLLYKVRLVQTGEAGGGEE